MIWLLIGILILACATYVVIKERRFNKETQALFNQYDYDHRLPWEIPDGEQAEKERRI